MGHHSQECDLSNSVAVAERLERNISFADNCSSMDLTSSPMSATTTTTTMTTMTMMNIRQQKKKILDKQDVSMKVDSFLYVVVPANPPAHPPQAIIANARAENAESRWQPNVTYKVKILVSYAQIAMVLSGHGTHLSPVASTGTHRLPEQARPHTPPTRSTLCRLDVARYLLGVHLGVFLF